MSVAAPNTSADATAGATVGTTAGTTAVAILGSGHIGTDLAVKLGRSATLHLVAMAGVDADSPGLRRAADAGVFTTADGLDGLRAWPGYADVAIVFDATSAAAHLLHAPLLAADGKLAVDLTPAAVGPFVVPVANEATFAVAANVNMVTCGGQATIPIVYAASTVTTVHYAEIVAAIASRSAGPGTRANIDEFTRTTARGLEVVGGAARGKAIIVLNPAEPPIVMRDTVHLIVADCDPAVLVAAIEAIIADVAAYVPGYRLKAPVVHQPIVDARLPATADAPSATVSGIHVTVLLEVEGAGDWLPKHAGNLDIMTAAAVRVGERLAQRATAARSAMTSHAGSPQ
jgi:acetaldehyde dehydrogenase